MEVVIHIPEPQIVHVTEGDDYVIFISAESDTETLVVDQ